MRYLSVCSGIEAATVAWHPLGWEAVAYAEVDAFPSAVLKHHYPTVPNYGDMTKFQEWPDAAFDLLVGGTPCQSFSVAGLRKGLGDPRGNLALTFLAIADRYRPRWVVWENVPGVLSSDSHDGPDPCPPSRDLDGDDGPADGEEVVVEDEYDADEVHAFACLLAGFSELGYFGAYGTLDAQYAGLAQRRKRVFAVFHLGDWPRAAAVLFDRTSLSGHPAPRREAGQVAPTVPSRRAAGGGLGTDFDCDGGLIAGAVVGTLDASYGRLQGCSGQDLRHGHSHLVAFGGNDTRGPIEVATAVNAHGGPVGRLDFESETFIAHALRGDGFDASDDGSGRGTPLVATYVEDVADPLTANEQSTYTHEGAVFRTRNVTAFSVKDSGADAGDIAPTLRAGGHASSHANGGVMPAVAFNFHKSGNTGSSLGVTEERTDCLRSDAKAPMAVYQPHMAVRRLTPRECERLQGFPDDYTLIPYRGKLAADGPRYKALGNSMAVPCMAWIGERIQMVNDL